MTKSVDNSQDIIDSRDVIARIEQLESDLEDLNTAVEEAQEAVTVAEGDERAFDVGELREALAEAKEALADWEDADELKALKSLAEEADGYSPDWKYGETLIRDSYFKDYAQELAEDIGAIDRNASWPLHCIDWEQAANELKMDYTPVSFDGIDYWIRS